MDLPAAISLPATKVDAALSIEDTPIALSSIAIKSRASVANSLGLTHDVPATGMISGVPANLQTLKSREYIQFVALCWFHYLEGWNDGANGPLLPRIQRVYGVRLFQSAGGCC